MNMENYARQASKPEFYESNDTSIFLSATSGMSHNFMSLSFTERFSCVDGEIYNSEELFALLDKQFGEEHDFSEIIDDADLSSLEPACLSDAVSYQSSF